MAQIGLKIDELWPGVLPVAVRAGQPIADVACLLMDRLFALRPEQEDIYEPETFPKPEEKVEPKKKTSQAAVVRSIIASHTQPFTVREIIVALAEDGGFIKPGNITSTICYGLKRGWYERVETGVYRVRETP